MIKIKISLSVLTLLYFTGCFNGDYRDSKQLIDYYYLRAYSENEYMLKCKLGCDGEIFISSPIIKVHWNNTTMLIERKNNEEIEYYLILAKKESLKCCSDILIGPFYTVSLDSILSKNDVKISELNKSFSTD